jgi:hypothetical protein
VLSVTNSSLITIKVFSFFAELFFEAG